MWPVTSFGLLKRQCKIEIHQEKEKENETDTTDNSFNIILIKLNALKFLSKLLKISSSDEDETDNFRKLPKINFRQGILFFSDKHIEVA